MTLYQINRSQDTRAGFAAAVASSCRLDYAVHPGGEADHTGKGNIHSGFDDLGGDADRFLSALFQCAQQLVQRFPAMGHAHGGREGKERKVPSFQEAVEMFRLTFFIADD